MQISAGGDAFTVEGAGVEREDLPGAEDGVVGEVPLREVGVEAVEFGRLEGGAGAGEEQDGHASCWFGFPILPMMY